GRPQLRRRLQVLDRCGVPFGLHVQADRLAREHQQLKIVGGVDDAPQLFADDDRRTAILHVRRFVQSLDKLKERLTAERVEVLERLLAFLAGQLAGVVQDEAVDDALELRVLLLREQRQTRRQRMRLAFARGLRRRREDRQRQK